MASKIKVDQIQTADGSGTIALQNQLSGMTTASLPTGSVVQVVQFRESTNYSTTSNSYVQGPQTGTFTMKDSSNKVLVKVTALMVVNTSGNYNGIRMAIYRGSIASGTRIDNGTEPQFLSWSDEIWGFQTREVLDTPSSSTVTYSIGFNKHSVASAAHIRGGYGETTITMMEIAG